MSNATNDGAGVTAQARAYLDAHLAMDDHGWTAEHELRLIDLLDAVDAVHAGLAAQLESARRANATLLVDLDRACAQRNRMAEELERVSAERDSLAVKYSDARAFGERLEACAEEREDVTLWGVDYVALPVGADGKPWHIGDTIEWDDGSTSDVIGIGDGVLFYEDGGLPEWTQADNKRHHDLTVDHATTVEDVLREFASDFDSIGGNPDEDELWDKLLSDYAPRLRLAEDGDAPC